MEANFWASRVHSGKHLSAIQAARVNDSESHLDTEVDDVRAWFPCPFCYVHIAVGVLCSHLQEEHCFSLKNAVCPICAATLGKDAIGHFTLQHAHLIKRKSHKSEMNSRTFISLHLGSGGSSRLNGNKTAADPLLFPFLCNLPFLDTKTTYQQDEPISSNSSNETRPEVLDEAQEEDYKERMQRTAFLQQLILSTFFSGFYLHFVVI